MLEGIVAQEPDYPPALTSLAEVVVLLRGGYWNAYGEVDPDEARAIAAPLLQRALQIDPDFADAFAVQGLTLYSDGEYQQAELALRRAVELNPSLSNAWNWRSITARGDGRLDDAERYIGEALKIDPLWLTPNNNVMFSLASQWRMDEAFALLERLRPFHQDTAGFHNMDAFLLRETGQLAASNSAAKRSYELDPDTPSIGLGLAFSYLLLQDTETAIEFVPPMMGIMRTYLMGTWEEALPEL